MESRLPGLDKLAHLLGKGTREDAEYLGVLIPFVKRSARSFVDRVAHHDTAVRAGQATHSAKIGVVVKTPPVGIPGPLDSPVQQLKSLGHGDLEFAFLLFPGLRADVRGLGVEHLVQGGHVGPPTSPAVAEPRHGWFVRFQFDLDPTADTHCGRFVLATTGVSLGRQLWIVVWIY